MITTILKKNRTKVAIASGAVVIVLAVVLFFVLREPESKDASIEVSPVVGDIKLSVTATGTVEPENRLEVKPPIAGRINEILVKEGDDVKKGEIVAWLSSTERAAILDAASSKSEEERKYWEDAYKPTPLIAPIDGEVIVSTDQPGQTITVNEAIIVISDHLIVKARVDETDIGRVKIGQIADIGLDAYPDVNVQGKVEHISYESKVVNNVTTYEVYIRAEKVPDVFRSGMSANVEIVENGKENVLTLPIDAIKRDDKGEYVNLRHNSGGKISRQDVQSGLCDDKNCEIVSGLKGDEKIVVTIPKYEKNGKKVGSSPFMPGGRVR